jgi:glycosyltransferase involved in cell wall biosynthesis
MTQPRVALVHDSLAAYGDPERVLEGLHRLYPQAPIYTAYVHPQWEQLRRYCTSEPTPPWDFRPLGTRPLDLGSPLALWQVPRLWESLDLRDYEVVISSTWGGLSHGVRVAPHSLHLCYCHTPDLRRWGSPDPGLSPWQEWIQSQLRRYDFYAAQRVDRWVTNSHRVARRIHRAYQRSADVIPPPVTLQGYGQAGERHYLYIGDLDRRYQVDLLVQACTRLDRPLRLVGEGRDRELLQQMAGESIEFLGLKSGDDLQTDHIYANAMALIYPHLGADFGFVPLEAMGRGLPVIAYGGSGMAEIVLHYRTGLLFPEPTVDSLCASITEFERLRFFSQACIDRAEEFAAPVFASKFDWYLAQALEDFRSKPGLQP